MPAVTPERQQIERLVRGEHHEPHRLLGAHLDGDQVRIRAWRPDATGVVALIGDDRATLTKIHPAGLFRSCFHAATSPPTGWRSPTGTAASPSTTPTGFCRPSGSSTSTCSARPPTSASGRSWAPTSAPSTAWPGPRSRSGRPTPARLSGAAGPIALVAANLYVFAFGMSWGPVVWVMLGEKFPNRIRAAALSVAAAAQWIANWLISTTFPALSDIGLGLAYGIYTAAAILSFFFVVRFVSETKGKELEEMRV